MTSDDVVLHCPLSTSLWLPEKLILSYSPADHWSLYSNWLKIPQTHRFFLNNWLASMNPIMCCVIKDEMMKCVNKHFTVWSCFMQCGILMLFNLASVLLVFPAVVSLDLLRRIEQRVDVFCCFKRSA